MTLEGKVLDRKGLVQGSPNEKERCQEIVEMPEPLSAHLTPVTTQGSYFFCI